MAKTLIATFLLCVAVATVATVSATTTKASPTPTSTAKPTTTTTIPPTTLPTTKTTTTTPNPPTTLPTTKTTTTTPNPPTTLPTTKTTTTTPKPPTTLPTTKTTTTTPNPPTTLPTTKTTTTTPNPPTPASASTATPPTGTSPTEGSSVSPNTGSSPTNAPSTAPVTVPPKPPSACASNPCRGESTCEERFDQTFTCLCLPGDYYDSGCIRGKVFPALLFLVKQYEDEMADKTSETFNNTAKTITDEIDKKFSGGAKGYIGASVLELREQKPNARAQRQQGNVEASVEIIYESTAEITQDTVTEAMKVFICPGCALNGNSVVQNLCDSGPCDTSTSTCKSTDGNFICSCIDGYKETDYSERLCMACPSGEKPVNNKCVKCAFGYNGLNCNDNTLLIVVIVCSVLGGLLIIALIALPLVAKKSKKKSSKRNEEDIGKPYQSHSVAKAPLSYSNGNSNDFSASVKEPTNSLANSGAPRIPRATANSNWDSRTNLEMTPSNSRQNLIPSGMNSRFNDNQDDMYSFSQNRPKNNPYEEMQPKSNPYSQNRASNPYAQIRGQTNPYYN